MALSDLFGIVTGSTAAADYRDGHDVFGSLCAGAPALERLVAVSSRPGTRRFQAMVREGHLTYVHPTNGGRELLFDPDADLEELVDRASETRSSCSPRRRRPSSPKPAARWRSTPTVAGPGRPPSSPGRDGRSTTSTPGGVSGFG